ncbi:VTT domain-containing protein [Oscillibacter sp. MSJ-2]|uniref:TVP38/TMEM64 family membrane protein n=1 Tax=Dysosmobacter acutus TaxID=2841504 RepID=A0ABS6F685_9FIRM|nr:VTT domain-containing protein [Dysosmobacter acutus]MBU5625801.1 VTT domain-containing protein [Dysosmobacter acutus]
MEKREPLGKRFLRLVPMVVTIGLVIWVLGTDRDLTVEALLSHAPENQLLAALLLLLLYAVKSLSVLLPLALFEVAATLLFPLPAALAVNMAGVAVACSVPFFTARLSTGQSVERLIKKHPKLHALRDFRVGNDFIYSFLVRVVGLFSCDIVSMYMGASGLRYWPYVLGSVLGFAPQTICFTLMGDAIREPGSPQFLISLAVMATTTAAAVAAYGLWRRRRGAGP